VTVIRTKEGALYTLAARLRSDADELEQLASDSSSYMPPPPLVARHLSFRQKSIRAIRAKRISLPAAGGWAAVIALTVELLRALLEHVPPH
jgi:hypothetical protein